MLLELSQELLNNIVGFLDYKDKTVLACTCKSLANIEITSQDHLCILLHKIVTTVGNNYTFFTSPCQVEGMRLWHTINVYVDMIVVFQFIFTRKGNAIFSKCLHCPRYKASPTEIETIIHMFQKEKPISNRDTIADNELVIRLQNLLNA